MSFTFLNLKFKVNYFQIEELISNAFRILCTAKIVKAPGQIGYPCFFCENACELERSWRKEERWGCMCIMWKSKRWKQEKQWQYHRQTSSIYISQYGLLAKAIHKPRKQKISFNGLMKSTVSINSYLNVRTTCLSTFFIN